MTWYDFARLQSAMRPSPATAACFTDHLLGYRRNRRSGRQMATEVAVKTAAWSVHVAEIHVLRQMEVIEELRRDGHSTVEAERHLQMLEGTLETHQQILDGLRPPRA
jgi:hypothetical protein